GFPYTPQGQKDIMFKMSEELIAGGAIVIIYWEPAWISSPMRDLWGQGSAWENVTYFDFEGNALPAFGYVEEVKGR
ncbi:MAG TPA: glycosyl hydrolase 53 family protein, partial [Anditalea sp.]|nr:glycosyl hydrolase 53 family protein [Anditalea sp.]